MRRFAYVFVAVLPALLFTHCGKSTSATVKVGSIPNSSSLKKSLRQLSRPASDAVQSTTEFAFAKVDGIKLNLTRLQALNGGRETDILEWSPAKEVVIAPGTDNTIQITETASVPVGTYTGVKVRYENSFSVKAFCRTNTKFVYTTATGVQTQPVGAVADLPADYDYWTYPFAEITTATSATGGNAETMASTDVNLNITESSSLNLAVLFDPSYLVTCYDGTSFVGSGNGNTLAPFNWSNNHGLSITDFFQDANPNFGIGYVPIFIWATTDASEVLPTAETYASSLVDTSVNGATINYKNVSITSFAFKSDGSILDARSRISSGGGGELYQFFTNYSLNGTNHSMKNGEWICEADYSSCRVIEDRAVTNFSRTADFSSTSSSTFENGPDCGATLLDPNHPEWGNRARVCLGSSATMFWRQLKR